MLLSHQKSFPLMKKPLPDQFVNLPLPGRCDSAWLERWMAHTVCSTAPERDGRKARLTEKALLVGTGFPKQRRLSGAEELLLHPSATQNQTQKKRGSFLKYLQYCKVKMLCWSGKCPGRIWTAEHPLSRALKGLQHGVTRFSPRWKAALWQGPMGLVPIVGGGTAPCVTWHQKMLWGGLTPCKHQE